MHSSKLQHVPIGETKKSSLHQLFRQHWRDALIVVVIAVLASFLSYQGAQLINPAFTFDKDTGDVWFHNDTTRVFDDMAIYAANHYRSDVHPLFVLITLPPVYILKIGFGLESVTAVWIIIAIVAALWFSSLFILLRLIGCRQLDAALFSILAGTSASSIFWFVIPETYPFGSLSILLALGLVALAQHIPLSQSWYLFVNTLTLGFTVTNWMAGILATVVNYRWKQSLLITFKTFCITALLVVVQKLIFPAFNTAFLKLFVFIKTEATESYVLAPESGGPITVIKCILFDTIVMPSINLVKNVDFPTWSRMSIQLSSPGSASYWGYIAIVLWIALLSLGLWGLFSIKTNLKLRIVLGFTLLGQIVLHVLYGDETFLHSLHFLPLLVVLATLSTLTRARLLALGLAGALILSAGVNNALQFNQAVAFTQGNGSLCSRPLAKCGLDSKIISKINLN